VGCALLFRLPSAASAVSTYFVVRTDAPPAGLHPLLPISPAFFALSRAFSSCSATHQAFRLPHSFLPLLCGLTPGLPLPFCSSSRCAAGTPAFSPSLSPRLWAHCSHNDGFLLRSSSFCAPSLRSPPPRPSHGLLVSIAFLSFFLVLTHQTSTPLLSRSAPAVTFAAPLQLLAAFSLASSLTRPLPRFDLLFGSLDSIPHSPAFSFFPDLRSVLSANFPLATPLLVVLLPPPLLVLATALLLLVLVSYGALRPYAVDSFFSGFSPQLRICSPPASAAPQSPALSLGSLSPQAFGSCIVSRISFADSLGLFSSGAARFIYVFLLFSYLQHLLSIPPFFPPWPSFWFPLSSCFAAQTPAHASLWLALLQLSTCLSGDPLDVPFSIGLSSGLLFPTRPLLFPPISFFTCPCARSYRASHGTLPCPTRSQPFLGYSSLPGPPPAPFFF